MSTFSCETSKEGPVFVIRANGYFDDIAGKQVFELFKTVHQEGFLALILNFSGSPIISSPGISWLFELFEFLVLENGGKIAFVGLSNASQGIFRVVGLLQKAEHFKTEEEAIQSLK